jgi:hypothetical protein
MVKKFIYNGIEYASEFDVRNAICKKERKIFSKAPPENASEFWAALGVTYIEEQEPIESLKLWKSRAIKQAFLNWREHDAKLISSLGFEVDSNERANADVSGLLVVCEGSQEALVTFRDADNQFRALTYEQLKVLQKEIIENGTYAYAQKWALDAQVESATTKEDLDAIKVGFEGKNFLEG